jgi:hypothetical protein
MTKGRLLYSEKLNDHPDIGVYGIFDTNKVKWEYYIISYRKLANGGIELTNELCQSTVVTYESIKRYAKEFKTVEDAKQFISEYKVKWETGSNNTTQEIRGKKLDELLE